MRKTEPQVETRKSTSSMTEQHDIVDVPFRPALDEPIERKIVLNLPFPPSSNSLFANRTGKGRVRSERYREWANAAGWALQAQRPGGLKGPVDLTFAFEERSNRKRDLGNLEKAVTDLLVTHQVIDADDHTVVRRIALAWNPHVQGCRVCITPAREAA